MPLTVNEVKAQLPDVKVAIDGRVYTGRVTGRAMPFATVTITHPVFGEHHIQYSWQAIKRAVNSDTPLTV